MDANRQNRYLSLCVVMSSSLTRCTLSGVLVLLWGTLLCAQSGASSDTKENLDLPYDAGGDGDKGADEDAPEVVVFYGQSFEGDGIFYCLDRSSSTADGELNIEQRETVRNIMDFSSRIKFGVVFYDSGVEKFPASGLPVEATASNKQAAVNWVMQVVPGTGTCVKRGLLEALKFANRSTAKRNVLIYLGDGFTTCPQKEAVAYSQKTLTEVRSRNTKNIQINAICVGTQVSEDFPKALAAMNAGTYSRVTR